MITKINYIKKTCLKIFLRKFCKENYYQRKVVSKSH